MNMLDYLVWRGDLTFAQSEFNEVDNLILCYLVYVNLDGIAPEMGEEAVSVRQLSETFFTRYSEKELEKDKSFIRFAPVVLKEMAQTRRFGDLLVQNYVNKVDLEKMLQFAAMEIQLGDGTTFVAYRGTDDTIVGWKEDFYLSRGVVPAEKEAVDYLNHVGEMHCRLQSETAEQKGKQKFSLFSRRKKKESCEEVTIQDIRIGGHSKGGNLAIYAAAYCEESIQNHIMEVYSNDGPGFMKEFLEYPGFQKICGRIRRYVPESSIIGMLLYHSVEPIVIESSQKAVMQHDGFSWEVSGPAFVRCEGLSNFALAMDQAIRNWLEQIPQGRREAIICDLFSVLEATDAVTLTELQDGGIKNIRVIMKAVEAMDTDSKGVVQDLLKEILQNVPQMLGIKELANLAKRK